MNIIDTLNLKQLIFICIGLCFIFGVVLGFTIGISEQLKHDNKVLNISANSNIHLLRNGNIYYSIHPYNTSLCNNNDCTNYTIIGE